jgi:hypothetical protein
VRMPAARCASRRCGPPTPWDERDMNPNIGWNQMTVGAVVFGISPEGENRCARLRVATHCAPTLT